MGILDAIAGGLAGGAQAGGQIADEQIAQQNRMQLNQQTSDLQVAADKQVLDYKMKAEQDLQSQVRARRAGYANGTTDMGQVANNALAGGEGDYAEQVLGAQQKAEKSVPYGGVVLDANGKVLYDNSLARNQAILDKQRLANEGKVDAATARANNVSATQKLLENASIAAPNFDATADGKPHAGLTNAFRTVTEGYAASGMSPAEALSRGRMDVTQDAADATQDTIQAGYKSGTPEFEAARTNRLNQYVAGRLRGPQGASQPPAAPGAAPAKPGVLGANLPAMPGKNPPPDNPLANVSTESLKAMLTNRYVALTPEKRAAIQAEITSRHETLVPGPAQSDAMGNPIQ